jgi:hypothetical protein
MFTPADCNNAVYITCGDHTQHLHTKSHISSSDADLFIAIKLQTDSNNLWNARIAYTKCWWQKWKKESTSKIWSNNVKMGLGRRTAVSWIRRVRGSADVNMVTNIPVSEATGHFINLTETIPLYLKCSITNS